MDHNCSLICRLFYICSFSSCLEQSNKSDAWQWDKVCCYSLTYNDYTFRHLHILQNFRFQLRSLSIISLLPYYHVIIEFEQITCYIYGSVFSTFVFLYFLPIAKASTEWNIPLETDNIYTYIVPLTKLKTNKTLLL